MVESSPRTDASLAEILAAKARAASDVRLGLHVGVGTLVATTMLLWHPPGWKATLSLAVCVLCYGLWGIADRELESRAEPRTDLASRAFRVTRVVTVVAASVATLVLARDIFGILLGRFIS